MHLTRNSCWYVLLLFCIQVSQSGISENNVDETSRVYYGGNDRWSKLSKHRARCRRFSVTNGVISANCSRSIGSSCTFFHCNFGYKLRNISQSNTSTCTVTKNSTSAFWKPQPKCKEILCRQVKIRNAAIQNPSCLRSIRSTCSVSCSYGYQLVGIESSTCTLQNSRVADWSPALPQCEEILCPSTKIANGAVQNPCSRSIRSNCSVSCSYGYQLVGSESSTCTLQNSGGVADWSPVLPRCEEILCPAVEITNAAIQNPSCSRSIRSTCSVSCSYGYQSVGSESSTCTLQNSRVADWSPALPRCEEILCPAVEIRDAAIQNPSCSRSIRSTCSVSCSYGYQLVGIESSTCTLQNSRVADWSPALPRCEGDIQIIGLKTKKVLVESKVQLTYTVVFTSGTVNCTITKSNNIKILKTFNNLTRQSNEIQYISKNLKKTKNFVLLCTQQIDGQTFSKTLTTLVIVDVPSRIKLSQSYVEVMVSKSKSISCTSDGNPRPTVTWMKNGRSVSQSMSPYFVYQSFRVINATVASSKLTFRNITFKDSGTYSCMSSNNVVGGQTSDSRNLAVNVIGAPILALPTDYVVSPQGNKAEFTCAFHANPIPIIDWIFFNGTTISQNSQFQIGNRNVTNSYRVARTLTVYGVQCKETSLISYKCSATNQHGSTESGVFIAGINSQLLSYSSASVSCSDAIRHCRRQGGKLVVVPSQDILNSINDIPTENYYWISEETTVYFVGNNNVTPNKNGCIRIWSKYRKWSKYQQDIASVLCEKSFAPEPEINQVIDECDGRKLEVEWNIIPGAMSLTHRVVITLLSNMSTVISSTTLPGEHLLKLASLKPRASYQVQVRPLFAGCENASSRKVTKVITGRGNLTVPSHVQLAFFNYECLVTWNNKNVETEIGSFEIRITQRIRYQPLNTATNFETNQTRINKTTTSCVIRNLQPNTDYQIEVGVVPSSPCEGRIPTVWSEPVNGTCVTSTSGPSIIKLSSAPPLVSQGQASITLEPVSERNGLISCYFVVVQYLAMTSDGNKTVEMNWDELRQSDENSRNAKVHIALALQRFNEKVNLGDGSLTCCDVTSRVLPADCSSTENNRKRRASSTVVRAQNRQLTPGANFTYYVVTSTPSDNGTIYTASSLSQPFVVVDNNLRSGSNVGLIVGIIVAMLLLIVLIVVMYKRRHQILKKKSSGRTTLPMPPLSLQRNDSFSSDDDDDDVNVDDVVIDLPLDASVFAQYDIDAFNLLDNYISKHENEDFLFKEEFKTTLSQMVKDQDISISCAKLLENKCKNRYKNISPSDDARVVLRILPNQPHSDYINASFINGFSQPAKFIAAQGPKPNTVNDFWRMIFEHNCNIVVMTTLLKEGYKVKCEKYWPDVGEEKSFGDVVVRNNSEISYGEYISRTLTARLSYSKEVMAVSQFQFVSWPDHGIPSTTSALLRFHEAAIKVQPANGGQILVHCSAGVGRTGTFIALDILKEQLVSKGKINVFKTIYEMRMKRTEMVQTLGQYVYIHKLITEINQFGITDVDVTEFSRYQANLKIMNLSTRLTGMQIQFEQLSVVPPSFVETQSADKPTNKSLNADSTILPYDNNLAFVGMASNDKEVPYINGSNIPTYTAGFYFIAAQDPLRNSVHLFWRCVLDNGIKCVVMATEDERCAKYWADGKTEVKFHDVTVSTTCVEECFGYIQRSIKVFKENEQEPYLVKQIEMKNWPKDGIPSSTSALLEIISIMNKCRAEAPDIRGKKFVGLIHCWDGSSQALTFCAISNLLERLKNENCVDVFRTLKDMRDLRASGVGYFDQYNYCYRAVSEFLESFDLYGNFE